MGEFNGISSLASGLTSGLTCVVKICGFTYALKAVNEQTFAYLQTTEHVSENIKTAQRLLQERENFLAADEKRDMDRVIRETETAVRCVAKLLEPARVDREAEQKIRLSTRGLWVLRDNPNITAALNRLQIAHNALNQVIGSLRASQISDGLSPRQAVQSGSPPPYRAGNLLHWRRQSRLSLRRDGTKTPNHEGLGIRDVPSVAVEELSPAPVTPPQQNGTPSSTVPSASQNRAQYSEPLFSPDSSRDEATAPSYYSAPELQKPFHETFSAAQPWHHPPDTISSAAGGCSTDPEAVSPTTAASRPHIPRGFHEVFAGLETADPNGLPSPTQARSYKTWLSYQASRSGRWRRPDRYSLP